MPWKILLGIVTIVEKFFMPEYCRKEKSYDFASYCYGTIRNFFTLWLECEISFKGGSSLDECYSTIALSIAKSELQKKPPLSLMTELSAVKVVDVNIML